MKTISIDKLNGGKSLKGFTLVELLIVIAILAVLAAAVVIVLNPGELLAQARDSQRLSDLETLTDALSIYIAQVTPIDLGSCPAGGRCTSGTAGPFLNALCTTNAVNTVAGSGWVDVDFTDIPGGSPVPFLPIDPSNGATYFYAYACSESPNYVFELDAVLESAKHSPKMTSDGGDKTTFYEVGTAQALAL